MTESEDGVPENMPQTSTTSRMPTTVVLHALAATDCMTIPELREGVASDWPVGRLGSTLDLLAECGLIESVRMDTYRITKAGIHDVMGNEPHVTDFASMANLRVIGTFRTKDECIAFFESEAWSKCDARTRAVIGLCNSMLCMPFGELRDAVEEFVDGGLWSHHYADNRIMAAVLRDIVTGSRYSGGAPIGPRMQVTIDAYSNPPSFTCKEVVRG